GRRSVAAPSLRARSRIRESSHSPTDMPDRRAASRALSRACGPTVTSHGTPDVMPASANCTERSGARTACRKRRLFTGGNQSAQTRARAEFFSLTVNGQLKLLRRGRGLLTIVRGPRGRFAADGAGLLPPGDGLGCDGPGRVGFGHGLALLRLRLLDGAEPLHRRHHGVGEHGPALG